MWYKLGDQVGAGCVPYCRWTKNEVWTFFPKTKKQQAMFAQLSLSSFSSNFIGIYLSSPNSFGPKLFISSLNVCVSTNINEHEAQE